MTFGFDAETLLRAFDEDVEAHGFREVAALLAVTVAAGSAAGVAAAQPAEGTGAGATPAAAQADFGVPRAMPGDYSAAQPGEYGAPRAMPSDYQPRPAVRRAEGDAQRLRRRPDRASTGHRGRCPPTTSPQTASTAHRAPCRATTTPRPASTAHRGRHARRLPARRRRYGAPRAMPSDYQPGRVRARRGRSPSDYDPRARRVRRTAGDAQPTTPASRRAAAAASTSRCRARRRRA